MAPTRRAFVLNEVKAARNSPVASKVARKSGVVTLRKMHPSTSVMVGEAFKELDSRKGISKQAIQNFIKRKYPSVDQIRLNYFVRRALRKGLEDGTLVRPLNSTVTTGAVGKFRLAPKRKESKAKVESSVQKAAKVEPRVQKAAKVENVEPNVQTSLKVAKEAPKTKAGGTKKAAADEQVKPPKKKATKGSDKSKKDEEAPPSKVPPEKKPKGKKTAKEDVEEAKGTVRTKAKPKDVKEAVADGKTKAKPKEAKGKADKAAPKSAPKKGRKKNAE